MICCINRFVVEVGYIIYILSSFLPSLSLLILLISLSLQYTTIQVKREALRERLLKEERQSMHPPEFFAQKVTDTFASVFTLFHISHSLSSFLSFSSSLNSPSSFFLLSISPSPPFFLSFFLSISTLSLYIYISSSSLIPKDSNFFERNEKWEQKRRENLDRLRTKLEEKEAAELQVV